MNENEAKYILIEIMELDDSMAQYNLAYMKAMEVAIKALEEVQQYRAIGTTEELRVLKDKQVAKKVSLRRVRKVDGFDMGKCPTCGEDVSRDCDGTDIFCPDCGQKLNWEDEG